MLTFGLLNNFYVSPELHVWILAAATLLLFIVGSIITYMQAARYTIIWSILILGILMIIVSFILGWNLVDIIMYRIQNEVPEHGLPQGYTPIGKR